ncbi:hypothetical protein JOL62DRAFT_575401 [Phyllosticta paracitricarpa]|uniref:Secreted protein n=1 Tax=Phyllosticta paracitricarpa TaxID=2016321 RepID=A0ABR1N5W3_9PEZI
MQKTNMQLSLAILLITLGLARSQKLQCCFSDVSSTNTGPCTAQQYQAHRDIINNLLGSAGCSRYSCGYVKLNRLHIWSYSEAYNCQLDLTGLGPGRQLPECYLQCIPMGQSGMCPQVKTPCIR